MPETSQKRRNSFLELVKGRWREFRREPSAFFFVVFMPILWMVILGFAFSRPATELYGVGWSAVGSSGALAVRVHQELAADAHVRLKEGEPAELERLQKRGDIQIVVSVDGAGAHYLFDPTNREAAQARRMVDGIVQRAAGRIDPVPASDTKVELPGSRYVDFLVPGLVALSIMTSSLFGTGMTLVANRREGLLKRYLATPMRPFEYIASHIVGRGFILAVELVAILVAALLIFRFQVEGGPGGIFAFVVFAALGAAAFTAIAMLCGSRTANMAAMNGMTNLISLPMMIVSGVWFSRSNFPDWMATAAKALPLTALVDGLRRIALEGAGLASLGPEAAILAAYLVVCAVAARVAFKWY